MKNSSSFLYLLAVASVHVAPWYWFSALMYWRLFVCNYKSLVCCFLIPITTCRRDVLLPSNLCLLGVGSAFSSRIRMSCRLMIKLHTYIHTYSYGKFLPVKKSDTESTLRIYVLPGTVARIMVRGLVDCAVGLRFRNWWSQFESNDGLSDSGWQNNL